MSESKLKPPIRLNPHSKSLFLRHSSQFFGTKGFVGVYTKKVFKLLNISRGFIYASRQYKVYFLEYIEKSLYRGTHKICLKTTNYRFDLCWRHVKVSLNELIHLNQLLKFPCVRLEILTRKYEGVIDDYKELLEKHLPQVEVDLFCDNPNGYVVGSESPVALQFISTFLTRIGKIECKIQLLQKCEPLKLTRCDAEQMENFGQFLHSKRMSFNINPRSDIDLFILEELKSILKKHSIKNLRLNCIMDFESKISYDYFDDFPTYPQLNSFVIMFPWDKQNSNFFPNLLKLSKFFPDLKKFTILIYSNIWMEDKVKPMVFTNTVLNLIEKIDKFQNECDPSVSFKLLLDLAANIDNQVKLDGRGNPKYPSIEDSIGRLRENHYFKNAKIGSGYKYNDYIYDSVTSNRRKENFSVRFCVEFRVPESDSSAFADRLFFEVEDLN